jgi:hypothetical protein
MTQYPTAVVNRRRTFHAASALGVAVALSVVLPAAAPAAAWPAIARSTAGVVAVHWAASVRSSLGAEPAGPCRRMDARRAVCPIGIALLVNDGAIRLPWRCSAEVLVWRAGGRLEGRRTATRCVPFPRPTSMPDPAAMVGTAVALDAQGDIACLPAGEGRTTCVLSYVASTAQRCIRGLGPAREACAFPRARHGDLPLHCTSLISSASTPWPLGSPAPLSRPRMLAT